MSEEQKTFQRPKMGDLFRAGGASSLQNSKHKRLFQSLQWRQAFEHSEFYEYNLDDDKKTMIKVRQIPNGEMKGLGTGTFVWPAAHILAKYLEKRYRESGGLRQKYVCDIGSGTGLTGIIAAALGARVLFTDQSCVLSLLSENVNAALSEANLAIREDQVEVKEYEWTAKVPISDRPFDYLIVSDCVLPKLYPIDMLVEAVDFVIGKETVAFFSYEHRPFPQYDPRQEFQRLCALKGLFVKVVPLAEHHETFCAEDIEIWEVRRASPTQLQQCIAESKHQCVVQTWGENKVLIPILLDGIQVRIHQTPQLGIGGILWPSSIICTRHVVKESFRETLAKKFSRPLADLKVLDLGAGCGLTSIALHRIGLNVVATDKENMISILQRNVSEYLDGAGKGMDNSIEVISYDWDGANKASTPLPHADIIVCSDCLYNSTSIEPLLEVLEKNTESTSFVLLVNELRTALEEFLYLSRRRPSFQVDVKEIVVTEPELELVRSAEEVKFSPPIRMSYMQWTKV